MMPLSYRLRTLSLAMACAAVLAACGGGSGDATDPIDPPVPPPPPPPPVQTLAAKHTGTWAGCIPDVGGGDSSELHSVILGEATPLTAGFHYRVEVYPNRDCSGDYSSRYQEVGLASFLAASKEVDGLVAEKVEVDINATYVSGVLAPAAWQMPGAGVYKRLFALAGDGSLAIADPSGDMDAEGFAERLMAPPLARVPGPEPAPSQAFADRYEGVWASCIAGQPEEGASTSARYTFSRTSATTLAMSYQEFQFPTGDCSGTGTLSFEDSVVPRVIAMGQSVVSGVQADRFLLEVPPVEGGQANSYLGVATLDGDGGLLFDFSFPGDTGDGYPPSLPATVFIRN